MAKKALTPATPKKTPAAAPKARAKAATSTEVRNSPIPKAVAAAPAPITPTVKAALTHDMIARRAFEIFASGQGASEFENWCKAEQQLRSEMGL